MTVSFSTKAGTLVQLDGRLRSARIAPLHSFTVGEWRHSRETCLARANAVLIDRAAIVRSSCVGEDGASASHAGAYLSVLNVAASELKSAVENVLASYGRDEDADEIFVQPMLEGVVRSGVAFSHDPNTCAPYRVITWTEGEDTTAVTGGIGGRTWQAAAGSPLAPPAELASGVGLIEERRMDRAEWFIAVEYISEQVQ